MLTRAARAHECVRMWSGKKACRTEDEKHGDELGAQQVSVAAGHEAAVVGAGLAVVGTHAVGGLRSGTRGCALWPPRLDGSARSSIAPQRAPSLYAELQFWSRPLAVMTCGGICHMDTHVTLPRICMLLTFLE